MAGWREPSQQQRREMRAVRSHPGRSAGVKEKYPDYVLSAWDSGEAERAARRDRKRAQRRHGMRVDGVSVKVLATLVPNRRTQRRRRTRRGGAR